MLGALLAVDLDKICTTPARETDLEVKIVKNWRSRDVLEVQKVLFAWQAQGFRQVAKYMAGAGVREGCKNVGRPGGFEEGLKRCVSRGRRSDFALCDVDVWSLRRKIRGRVANVTEVLLCSDHFAWQLQEFVCLGSTFCGRRSTFEASAKKSLKRIGILRSSVWSTCHFWRKSRKNASFLSFKASFLKEVSHKSFFFDLQTFICEGSLAQSFWSSKLQFSRKSRRNALFVIFKASCFQGSLAQKLRFWSSKFHFWKKSRTKASVLIFKASFLKEASHKSFVFELPNVIFEGSPAEMLLFWAA